MPSARLGILMLLAVSPEQARRLEAAFAAYSVEHVDSTEAARRLVTSVNVYAAVLQVDGDLASIDAIREVAPDVPLIAVVKRGSVRGAIAALHRGAAAVVEESEDVQDIVQAIEAVTRHTAPPARRQFNPSSSVRSEEPLIGTTDRMRRLFDLVDRAAVTGASVLVTGEYGTGKEAIARRIHAFSARSAGPFLTLNACGLSPMMVESLLFGQERGVLATSGTPGLLEQASGGTLFLDEITYLPPSLQPMLARVLDRLTTTRIGGLEEIAIDVRFVAATARNVIEALRSGQLAHNLLFRLNSLEIELPPLRERRDDIPPLAMLFLRRYAREYEKRLASFERSAMDAIIEYPWPGNVRELEHAVNRAVLACKGEAITIEDLALRAAPDPLSSFDDMTIAQVEASLVDRAMRRFGGNVSEAARALGLSRGALYRRLERYRTVF